MDYFASIICAREDNQWAMSLYHELEAFVVPSYLRKQNPSLRKDLRPIFYDYSDIPAGPSLKWLVAQRLKNSNYLIVVCSHNTCDHEWLRKDVNYFISTGKSDNIILYIVEESFNDSFPDDWKLFNLGGSVEAYHMDQKESIKRVAEIMLGLKIGSMNNNSPSLLVRFAQKIGLLNNNGSNDTCVLELVGTNKLYQLTSGCHIIGRGPECTIRIPDFLLARKEFTIAKEGHLWKIKNISKVHTLWVNDIAISGEWVLQDGDKIKVSSCVFRIHMSYSPKIISNSSDSSLHYYEQLSQKDDEGIIPSQDQLGGERQYSINTSTLTIRFGNILDSDAEVIVSSDDNELSMGGGVSGAILVNGGDVILDDARKNIPAQLGDVVITTAGKLPQKYIFHCVTIDYADGQRNASEDKGLQEYIIRRSVDKCLRMMPLLGIETIAFPAIGAGVAHFSLEEVAISMADLITDFLYTTSKQYQIEIYLYDRFRQRGVMDYLVFFENVAKSIDNHKKTNMIDSGIVEVPPVTMPETLKTRPFGKMAASSPNDEHKVFVSYSRDNIEIVRLFCEQMDNLGITYWIDVNGKYSGNNFKEVLVDAIDSSQVMLFLSSQESNQSPFVIKEISIAVSDNKTILPIKLDDAPYAKSIRFDLSDIDWIEFSKDKCDEAMEKFRYCLQLYLQ